MKPNIIAILITCYNRKEKTLACLKSLYKSIEASNSNSQFNIYLVDDGSSDGTSDAVLSNFPNVEIIQGSGKLFWAGGMRLAWNTALHSNPEYYLLLNDDTFLYENAINCLLKTSLSFFCDTSNHAIFIGSTIDEKAAKITYGGRKLNSRFRPNSYLINSDTTPLECDIGNANIMLVPRSIVQEIGILSEKYTHSTADFDYTLRAKKARFKVMVVPGILGICEHDHGEGWLSSKFNLTERIRYLYSPKGLAYKEYLFYIKSHFPIYLPEAFLKLWIKALFPFIYDRFKKG